MGWGLGGRCSKRVKKKMVGREREREREEGGVGYFVLSGVPGKK